MTHSGTPERRPGRPETPEFTIAGTLKDLDVMDRLGEIREPTLLICGRHDQCRPSQLEEMHRRLPDSEVAIIGNASHLCFAEQPVEFTIGVDDFLARTDSAASRQLAAR